MIGDEQNKMSNKISPPKKGLQIVISLYPSTMSDFDIDEVLNLEEEQYNLGFKEGQEHSTKEQYLEGKQYGYQTGFQRF